MPHGEEVNVAMAADGGVLAVVATDKKSGNGRFFFVNQKGKLAYLVFSDMPFGQHATCARVQLRWEAQLSDSQRSENFGNVKWSGDAAEAKKVCEVIGEDRCGFYDDQIAEYAGKGYVPYLQGITAQQGADGVVGGGPAGPRGGGGGHDAISLLSEFDIQYVGFTTLSSPTKGASPEAAIKKNS